MNFHYPPQLASIFYTSISHWRMKNSKGKDGFDSSEAKVHSPKTRTSKILEKNPKLRNIIELEQRKKSFNLVFLTSRA